VQISDLPAKFSIPWANSAGGGYVRTIPTASQIGITPGAASLTDGFPPLNFDSVLAGGVPPFGQDMNGILREITRLVRWYTAGGPISRDGTFSTAIGGYPLGAVLLATTKQRLWLSTADNNTTDPDAGGANWAVMAHSWTSLVWTAGGSANAQTLTLAPAASSLAELTGVPITMKAVASNTGAVTLAVNGLAATAVVAPNLLALVSGSLLINSYYQVVYNGTSFVLMGTSPSGFVNQQSFTSSGTWVCPAGIYRVKARAWGGGGGGGGGNSTGAGGGASGGGYAEGTTPVTPGVSYTVTVGSGGAGGAGGATGSDGTLSSFNSAITGGPGIAGLGGPSGLAPGQLSVGAGGGGTVNLSGQPGYGANGPFDGAMFGGTGGGTFGSGLAPSAISGTGAGGNPGTFPGGGGSGAAYNFGGGNGAGGLVIVEW